MRETVHSRQREYRWNILIISCAVTFGSYYCTDMSSVIHNQLATYYAATSTAVSPSMSFETFFNLLYVLYSLPNIFLPLLSGVLVEHFGVHRLLLLLAACVVLGQLVIALGIDAHHMPCTLFGRFVYGMGSESLSVVVVTLLSLWFEGKEVGLALAINLSTARLATTTTAWLSPLIAENHGVAKAYYFGCLLCTISLIAAVVLVVVDYYMTIPVPSATPVSSTSSKSPLIQRKNSEIDIYNSSSKTNYLLGLLLVLSYCCYGSIVTFNSISSSIVVLALPMEVERKEIIAARFTSIPFFLSFLFSAPLGVLVDHGHKSLLLLLPPLLLLPAYGMLYMHIAYALPIVMIGFAYAIFGAVVWPVVPLVVPPNATGRGFGLLASSQNLSTTLTPLLAAFLYSPNLRYDRVLLSFLGMAVIGVALGISIIIVDEVYCHAKLRLKTVQDTIEMPVLILDEESSSTRRPPLYRPSPLLTNTTGIAYYPKAKSATLTALINMEAQPLLQHTTQNMTARNMRPRSYSSIAHGTGDSQQITQHEFDREQLKKTKTIRRSFKF